MKTEQGLKLYSYKFTRCVITFWFLFRFKDSDLPNHHYSCQTYYGDGSEIEPAVLQHIRAVTWSCAVGFPWQNGDLLVVDNLAVQHARMSFTGPRRILAMLSENWIKLTGFSVIYSATSRAGPPGGKLTNHWQQRTGSFSCRQVMVCLTWKDKHYRPLRVICTLRDSILDGELTWFERISLKTPFFAVIKAKPLKSVQKSGAKLTYQQMAPFPERFATPRTLLGSQFC